MITRQMAVGPLQTNCYIAACEKTSSAVVIDPGFDAEGIARQIDDMGLRVVAIVNTHGHADHVMANDRLRAITQARVMIHRDDAAMLLDAGRAFSSWTGIEATVGPADVLLEDDSVIEAGELRFVTIHTPGHTPGSCCLACEDTLFSGDTLFAGSVGRVDLPGGKGSDLRRSLQALMKLPDDTTVLPGHGPETTIGRERRENPFVRAVAQ
jgi:glyoxylase-like metal-dependent hydrolase (beta-lactamase superfamily II)